MRTKTGGEKKGMFFRPGPKLQSRGMGFAKYFSAHFLHHAILEYLFSLGKRKVVIIVSNFGE